MKSFFSLLGPPARTETPRIPLQLLGFTLLGTVLTGGVLIAAPPVGAAVMGGPKSMPLDEAVIKGRQAAEAILDRAGPETCLRAN